MKALLLFLFSISHAQTPMGLNDFLSQAQTQIEDYQAVEKSLQALEYEITSREMELSPVLSAGYWDTRDQKDSFANSINRFSDSRLYTLGLSKPFSTGTSVSLLTNYELADQNSFSDRMHRADWEVTISQDLWRNSFGRTTRIRRARDQAELTSRKLDLIYRKQSLTNQIEALFWDFALQHKELEIQKENLKRSEKILDWTRKRLKVSAARDTDLLQAQALVATRKMDLADVERQVENSWAQLKILFPDLKSTSWIPDTKELDNERSISELLIKKVDALLTSGEVVRLDVLSSRFKQQELEEEARAVKDELAPRLSLELAHGRNGIRDSYSEASRRASGSDTPYSQVGVVLSWNLDLGLKDKRRQAAQLTSEAHQLQLKKLERENQVSWVDLQNQISHLKERLSLARELSKYQKNKSERERRYFEQGRSTTFQAITFEVEAAESELRVYRILNQLRKAESQARIFVGNQEKG